jgi:serine protease
MSHRINAIFAAALILPLVLARPSIADSSLEGAQQALKTLAEARRSKSRPLTFEQFKASVYKEPFEGGKFIVNGDTTIADEKLLREFFDKNVKTEPATRSGDVAELIVNQAGGLDTVWNATQKHRLTYCVSTQFGPRHDKVVAGMAAATQAWEAVADVDFHHLADEDANCTAANSAVLFDVRPVTSGQYLARAFFPNESRPTRNVLIDESSFALNPNDTLTLAGILRHELGHTLGFRHEHTRPDAGTCFEDQEWRVLTNYDGFSVMHYPQCNGLGDWSLTLTEFDKNGSACLYGPASSFTINAALCTTRIAAQVTTETFAGQTVSKGQERSYGPFRLVPGTQFNAEIGGAGAGAGDPDLYVKFNELASQAQYDCRPYLSGAEERCAIDAPSTVQGASVMVHGYDQGAYSLKVTYTKKQ